MQLYFMQLIQIHTEVNILPKLKRFNVRTATSNEALRTLPIQNEIFNIRNPSKSYGTSRQRTQNEGNTWEQSDRQSGVYLFRALTKWNSEKSNKLRGDRAVRMLTHIR